MSILSQLKQSQNTDFPNLRPSLDLRFALAKKLDPRITFTRGSTGTNFGSDGIMRTAGVNEPRFDHDPITGQSLGLLIEESRSNLLTYSEDISQYHSVDNASISTNQITSPDGTTTADKLTSTITGSSNTCLVQKYSAVAVNTATYTFSVFLKAGTSPQTTINLQLAGGTYQQSIATINWTSNTITSSSGGTSALTAYSNGWYRVSLTLTNNGTNNAIYPRVYVRGQGTDNVNGEFVYNWGWQTEEGAFPTSYIPTTASTVTRSADLASMTGTNFSSWYNQSEGTIYLETDKLYPGNFDAYRHPYKIDSGSNADQITAYVGPGGTIITNYGIVTGGGRQVNDYQQINIGSSPIRYKLGQSVSSKYFFFTTSTGRVPPQLPSKSAPNTHNLSLATNMSRLFIGNNAGGGQINSHISRLTYYPIQLTNQQLVNLTT